MPAIGRRDRAELQPLGDRDQRRADEADLPVLADEFLDTARRGRLQPALR
jgi:hypothetical protein